MYNVCVCTQVGRSVSYLSLGPVFADLTILLRSFSYPSYRFSFDDEALLEAVCSRPGLAPPLIFLAFLNCSWLVDDDAVEFGVHGLVGDNYEKYPCVTSLHQECSYIRRVLCNTDDEFASLIADGWRSGRILLDDGGGPRTRRCCGAPSPLPLLFRLEPKRFADGS